MRAEQPRLFWTPVALSSAASSDSLRHRNRYPTCCSPMSVLNTSWNRSKIKENLQIEGGESFDCDTAEPGTVTGVRNCAFTRGNREAANASVPRHAQCIPDNGACSKPPGMPQSRALEHKTGSKKEQQCTSNPNAVCTWQNMRW